MKEYWVNVYGYNEQQFVGIIPLFPTRNHAACYIPSWGLRVIYRIHVKMKSTIREIIMNAQKSTTIMPNKPKYEWSKEQESQYDSFFRDNSKIIKELG